MLIHCLKCLFIAYAEHNSFTAAAMNFGISKVDGQFDHISENESLFTIGM